ncbi:hypothetical protein N9165_03005, partial [Akkermansiaceae bacterium]|nr:hypothetical protein [Akkermansiaceae bacterium]
MLEKITRLGLGLTPYKIESSKPSKVINAGTWNKKLNKDCANRQVMDANPKIISKHLLFSSCSDCNKNDETPLTPQT